MMTISNGRLPDSFGDPMAMARLAGQYTEHTCETPVVGVIVDDDDMVIHLSLWERIGSFLYAMNLYAVCLPSLPRIGFIGP